jgi:6-phosphogluconolactonase
MIPPPAIESTLAEIGVKLPLLLVMFPMHLFAATLTGWIGTYTVDNKAATGSSGIYRFDFDTASGVLGGIEPAGATANPSFLAVHPNGRYLYAVNEESSSTGSDHIASFAIHQGKPLTALGSVASQGTGPCFLSVDRSGKWLFVANYGSGTVAVFPIRADGSLGEATQSIQQQGSGPVARRQQSAHAHQILQSPDGRFVLAVDLGADKVFVYRFDPKTGALTPNEPASLSVPAGYGPRHLVFAKHGSLAYLITEITPAVITLRWDARRGTLTQLAVASTLPADYTGAKGGAEIALHPDGRFLYASNRGDSNSIAIFRVGADGIPVSAGQVPSGGITPRFFAIDPSGRFLITAHQKSGDLQVFTINRKTGALTPRGGRIALPAPVALVFAPM